ncbi:MAG TPA: hypothetical protein DCP31_04630 [Cyanobacteria bacterium UBA8543]|nr:hypothetical protein [Cyanobacteria bacterium UBA8543]
MRAETFRFVSLWLSSMTLIVALTSCKNQTNSNSTPSPTLSATTPSPTTQAGKITDIPKQKVWVRQLGSTQEIPATEGMGIQVGETIRTENEGKVQIELKNGLAFRIGDNSAVTLQPDNQLNLTSGTMITWVVPGQKVPTQIVTPSGVAGIRGTTVYVQIPPDLNQGILFFTWEGKVVVQLKDQKSEMVLKTGDEVTIKPGETDFRKTRNSIKPMSRKHWSQIRRCFSQLERPECRQEKRLVLFRDFKTSLPTLSLIDKPLPAKASQQPQVTKPKTSLTPKQSAVRKQEPSSTPEPSAVKKKPPEVKKQEPSPTSEPSEVNKKKTFSTSEPSEVNKTSGQSEVNKQTSPTPEKSVVSPTLEPSETNKEETYPAPQPSIVYPTPGQSEDNKKKPEATD